MKLIPFDTQSDDFNLFLFGDTHEGNILTSKKLWWRLVNLMNSDYQGVPARFNYCLDHGDFIEAFDLQHDHFDPQVHSLRSLPYQQIREVTRIRKDIAHKLVAVLYGNHDWKFFRWGNYVKDMASDLEVNYGTWSAKIIYKNGDRVLFKHLAGHAFRKSINSVAKSPETRLANMRDQLRECMRRKFADTHLNSMGHTHKLIVAEPIKELRLYDDGRVIKSGYLEHDITDPRLEHWERWYVNTGGFMRLYGDQDDEVSGYAERMGLDPIELGFAIARVRNGRVVGIDEITL